MVPRAETLKARLGVIIQRIVTDGSHEPIFRVKDTDLPGRRMTTRDELAAWMHFDERVAGKLRQALSAPMTLPAN